MNKILTTSIIHPSSTHKTKGLSLVELMVALLISTVLLGGAISLMINSKRTYRTSDDLARLQENLRIASELMTYDFRMAGFFGCSDPDDPTASNNQLNITTGDLYDTGNAIEGIESSVAANWFPSNNSTLVSSINAATDAITIRAAATSGSSYALSADMSTSSDTITITNPGGDIIAAGSLMVIHDCSSSDIFQVTTFNNTTDTIAHVVDPNFAPGNASAALSKIYTTSASVTPLNNIRYYIDNLPGPNGGPALFRQVFQPVPDGLGSTGVISNQALVEGIQNLQLLYGLDTGNDNIPDSYVEADNVGATNWDNVIAVRFGLLGRTIDEYDADADTSTYDVNGTDITATGDRRIRRVLTNTVFLRNMAKR